MLTRGIKYGGHVLHDIRCRYLVQQSIVFWALEKTVVKHSMRIGACIPGSHLKFSVSMTADNDKGGALGGASAV